MYGGGCVFSLKPFESCWAEPAGAPAAPTDFDSREMMDNQPCGKVLSWESAPKAGSDCKEKRKCPALVMEGAKCNQSRQRTE